MGLIFRGRGNTPSQEERDWGPSGSALIPRRVPGGPGSFYITEQSAMSNSVVWAAIRLRADLISTMPMNCWRDIRHPDGTKEQLEAPMTGFMTSKGFMEFKYSSQVELDRSGNSIGIIEKVDAQGLPAEINLKPSSTCEVLMTGDKIRAYRIEGTEYKPEVIWHEKQFTVPGIHVGLSPVSYAAYQLGMHKSIQDFVSQWFTSGQGPRASLKNTEKALKPKDIALAQETWRASQSMGEPFVHGNDWEYTLIQAEQASADWIEGLKLSEVQCARMFGVPADLVDVLISGGSHITYQTTLQRNSQFLVMNLGPSIQRREHAFSYDLLPRPRYVEFDTDTLMRMDPMQRAQWIAAMIEARAMAPSEIRAQMNRKPFTEEQIKEFELLGLNRQATGALAGAANIPVPFGTQEEPTSPAELANQANQGTF